MERKEAESRPSGLLPVIQLRNDAGPGGHDLVPAPGCQADPLGGRTAWPVAGRPSVDGVPTGDVDASRATADDDGTPIDVDPGATADDDRAATPVRAVPAAAPVRVMVVASSAAMMMPAAAVVMPAVAMVTVLPAVSGSRRD